MNKLIYRNLTFSDADILSGSVIMENGMIADELAIDTLEIELYSEKQGTALFVPKNSDGLVTSDKKFVTTEFPQDILTDYVYGSPVILYHDNHLIGKFYTKSIVRTGKTIVKISCVSAVGLLDKLRHFGGIYEGVPAGSILSQLLEGFEYTIDDEVGNASMYGWLPAGNRRSNLHQLLFAIGASLVKKNGNIHIKYMRPEEPITIEDNRVFLGGNVDYPSKATEVDITEHGFYALETDEEVTLFDNTEATTTAEHQEVIFDSPCHDLKPVGITVLESGVNYAIVSGTGTLTGKKYTHTQKVMAYKTKIGGEENVVSVTDATLVSALNSLNVAKRVAAFYTTQQSVDMDIVLKNERTGSQVVFTDPFGEEQLGIVKSMAITLSSILKAQTELSVGWTPNYFGNNYNNYMVVTESGLVNLPTGITEGRAILIGGGAGGQAGFNGETPEYEGRNGGTGGQGGNAGLPGKVLAIDFEVDGKMEVNIGKGGAGGNVDGALGASGTATLFAGRSSDEGAIPEDGVINIITGEIYALPGMQGQNGGNGSGDNARGEDVIYKGVVYSAGEYGESNVYTGQKPSGTQTAAGGGGGGAVAGANGADGKRGRISYNNGNGFASGGNGGDGANAIAPDGRDETAFGGGGNGGNGGGGGGAGGTASNSNGGRYDWTGSPGAGGAGSSGSAGVSGALIIYY